MADQAAPVADLETETEFRSIVRDFVDKAAPLEATRRFVDGSGEYDDSAWLRAATELQAVEVGLPERAGGHGAGLAITGVLFEEFGRSLVPSSLLGTVGLVANVLSRVDAPEAREQLERLSRGRETASLGWVGDSLSWDPANTPVRIAGFGEDMTVSGTLHHVIDGDVTDTLYLAAKRDGASAAVSLVTVASDAPGLVRRRLEPLDLTRRLGRVELSDVPATMVGGEDESSALRWGVLAATALLAAESAGAARRAMELSVEYAKLRNQFGRPIGSFQAIKHKCADMLARVELMSAISREALRELDLHGTAAAELVHAAKAYASEAFFHVASEAIQVHGGIGFTWEHDAHLFYRRAKANDSMFGGAVHHRGAIAAAAGWAL